MISILLSFSLRVAGGVFRRRKSMTRVALKADIGRLRSARVVYDTDRHMNQRILHTKQPPPGEAQHGLMRRMGEGHIRNKQGPYHFPFWANEPPITGPTPPPMAQALRRISMFCRNKGEDDDWQRHEPAERAALAKGYQVR
jgi:hypothetical protein